MCQLSTKCSGERPICLHCHRDNHACVYEPYSATVGDHNPYPSTLQNAELLQRITLIESRLAELSGRTVHQTGTSRNSTGPDQHTTAHPFLTPPSSVRRAVV
ncbi:hypothetical protein ETB97_011822 [Aspergillus alliaceus]|uniref:Zn(2)-C6 fungal-type domain-containing protein n=1 Tax=Petromyces alliaceus TaxID=209559 RepID=A0A8H6A3Y7_PETAA|nr:hypothetical protein ETB97_011822 [Aspergillus burnettii]